MSNYTKFPSARKGTLHRPENEKDACGVGLEANINGVRSNDILHHGLRSCCNVVHRGAVDADMRTGDGAGITTQIPHKIFGGEVTRLGGEFEDPSEIGVGVFFMPRDEAQQLKARLLAEGIASNRGCTVFGWREVPTNDRELGEKAKESKPVILHFLLGRPEGMDEDSYERTLYIMRREIEGRATKEGIKDLYIPSFSHRTISYKALLVAPVLEKFFLDLQNPDYETAIALYHQRFSTNTFPSWPLAQPFRMLAHNGEINTVRGNRNWMASRETDFSSEIWGKDVKHLKDLLDGNASDSASLDTALELLVLSGRDIASAMTMLVPPAFGIDPSTTDEQRALYQFNSCLTEAWDGPASLVFTDGISLAATLDRNGLRPCRFKITEDGHLSLGSEVGTTKVDDAKVIQKGRLGPGQMLHVNTKTGKVSFDQELKDELAGRQPYADWLKNNRQELKAAGPDAPQEELDILGLSQQQMAFGYTKEEIDLSLTPLIGTGNEAIYSMGDAVSLSVLSLQPRLLYTYFRQLFAQVTNPPIDPIRERAVMSLEVILGHQNNILTETAEHARVIHLETPFLFESELEELKAYDKFPTQVIDITWKVADDAAGMKAAIERICAEAEAAADSGVENIILSDRATDHENVAIPALLATGAVHHHLNRAAKRMAVGIIVDTGEARDTHQMACLFGYGAQAICPYLAYRTIQEQVEVDKTIRKPKLDGIDFAGAQKHFRKGLEKGVLKIMSKMGISVLTSYQGAQIFEAVGLHTDLIDECFSGTASQVEGITYEEIARESLARHDAGFSVPVPEEGPLKLGDPGYYRWRRNGEKHQIGGPTIKPFHAFVRENDGDKYEEYLAAIKESAPCTLHDMMELVPSANGPIPIDQVEPIEDIRVRFTTAAMSLGAISPEAHEALAIAMNEIGGKSDSGEGGEDPARFNTNKNSKIKQIASGRFGVSAEYLANAEELEIKMAQGAKPGEGGQLPGHKVNGIIAKLRNTVEGVTLISPPPHHDIYSIEDLAQLIHDLKEVNPRARVCVKLVAENGIGTVAAGVAKANADIILISGHDGGTGASPLSSIKHAGLPWELGLSETQQVLMLNGLRDRVTLRTDGGFKNGRDVLMGALLGAEEFNFGTTALIALGCVYVRQCHLNTCPVGIATQRDDLRAKFKGDPAHVVNYFNAVAEETRQLMASIGVERIDDLVGHTEFLSQRVIPDHPKANTLDLSRVLRDVARENGEDLPRRTMTDRNDGNHPHPLDDKILQQAHSAIQTKAPVELSYKIKNTNRNVGTKLSGQVAYMHGNHGLAEGTITLNLSGSAGQSFCTFLCGGIKVILTGEANDYVGKGMSGGEVIIRPPEGVQFNSWENAILGNTVMYGATGGSLFAAGRGGERFCVRNSGGTAVVEGVGDHCCEYMTGGTVVILGEIGKNFGAGMSGGTAYILDEAGTFDLMHNPEMIEGNPLDADGETLLKELVCKHLERTDSLRAKDILDNWADYSTKFVKVTAKAVPLPAAEPEKKAAAKT